jgi:hypothetical protein
MENVEENRLNCEMILKIRMKSRSNREMIGKLQKKSKLNSEKIWKIQKKIVKKQGKYSRKVS